MVCMNSIHILKQFSSKLHKENTEGSGEADGFTGIFFMKFAMEFYTATWYTVTKNETNPKKGRKDTCRYYTRAQEAKVKQ